MIVVGSAGTGNNSCGAHGVRDPVFPRELVEASHKKNLKSIFTCCRVVRDREQSTHTTRYYPRVDNVRFKYASATQALDTTGSREPYVGTKYARMFQTPWIALALTLLRLAGKRGRWMLSQFVVAHAGFNICCCILGQSSSCALGSRWARRSYTSSNGCLTSIFSATA